MLVTVVEAYVPEHFTHAMTGNFVDCRVLAELLSRRLPDVSNKLVEMDVSVQLLATRWFLMLWSSVLPVPTLLRTYDALFTLGPTLTPLVALACFQLMRPTILAASSADDLANHTVSCNLRQASPDAMMEALLRGDVGELTATLTPSHLGKLRVRCRADLERRPMPNACPPAAAKRATLGASLQQELRKVQRTFSWSHRKPSAAAGSALAADERAVRRTFSWAHRRESVAPAVSIAADTGAEASEADASAGVADGNKAPPRAAARRPSRTPLGALMPNVLRERKTHGGGASKKAAGGVRTLSSISHVPPAPPASVRSSTRNPLPPLPSAETEEEEAAEAAAARAMEEAQVLAEIGAEIAAAAVEDALAGFEALAVAEAGPLTAASDFGGAMHAAGPPASFAASSPPPSSPPASPDRLRSPIAMASAAHTALPSPRAQPSPALPAHPSLGSPSASVASPSSFAPAALHTLPQQLSRAAAKAEWVRRRRQQTEWRPRDLAPTVLALMVGLLLAATRRLGSPPHATSASQSLAPLPTCDLDDARFVSNASSFRYGAAGSSRLADATFKNEITNVARSHREHVAWWRRTLLMPPWTPHGLMGMQAAVRHMVAKGASSVHGSMRQMMEALVNGRITHRP